MEQEPIIERGSSYRARSPEQQKKMEEERKTGEEKTGEEKNKDRSEKPQIEDRRRDLEKKYVEKTITPEEQEELNRLEDEAERKTGEEKDKKEKRDDLTEEEKERKIQSASMPEELIEAVKEIGPIEGEKSGAEMADKIDTLFNFFVKKAKEEGEDLSLFSINSSLFAKYSHTYGLREKIYELFEKEAQIGSQGEAESTREDGDNEEEHSKSEEEDSEDLRSRVEEERESFIERDEDCKELIENGLKGKELKKKRKEIEKTKADMEVKNINSYYIKAEDKVALESEDEEERDKAEKRKERYINSLQTNNSNITEEQAEAIYNTELQKEVYRRSKVEYGNKKMEERVKELIEEGEDEEEAKQIAKGELFQELFVDENKRIKEAEEEKLPPKEKRWYKKAADWYLRRNAATRLLISTGIVTGAVAGTGGFGASAAAAFAGYRFARGAGAVIVSKAVGAGFGWATSLNIEKKRVAGEKEMEDALSFNSTKDIKGVEERYKKHQIEIKNKERRALYLKMGTMIAVGAGTAIGAGMIENAYAGGATPESPETPSKGEPQPEKGGATESSAEEAEIATEKPPEEAAEKPPEESKSEVAEKSAELKKGGEVTLENRQEFYTKFVERFGEEGEYGVTQNQVINSLANGRVTPEEYYDFLEKEVYSGDQLPIDKEKFIEKLGRQIENYKESLGKEGTAGDVSQRAALRLLQDNLNNDIIWLNEENVVTADSSEVASGVVEKPEVEKASAVKLEIGSRGPQGAVIDHFRDNPDMARKFGAPDDLFSNSGEIANREAFDNWAGAEAHRVWLDSADEALKNEEVLKRLEELGYSKDIDGYGEMMRRIGEGDVVLDPEKGVMMMGEETDYLKSSPTPEPQAEPQPENSQTTEGAPEKTGEGSVPEIKKDILERTDLSFDEYEAMKVVDVGYLMEEIPLEKVYQADLIKQGKLGGSIKDLMEGVKLPTPESVSESYAEKQIELAKFLHEFNPDEETKHMSVEQFIIKKNDFWEYLKQEKIK